MADENADKPNEESPRTLSDDEITTERKIPRRSFLSSTGISLAGAAALVAGAGALRASPQTDPDHKKGSDPDHKKRSDPDQKKGSDPDRKKRSDPDKKKGSDPDKKKGGDPDK